MSVRLRQFVERQIIAAFVEQALEAGHNISVNDGEETTLWNSVSPSQIMKALMTTDEDHLYVDADRHPTTGRLANLLGEVACFYGNGPQVISDYHVNLESLMTNADALAEYWDAEGPWETPPKFIIWGV